MKYIAFLYRLLLLFTIYLVISLYYPPLASFAFIDPIYGRYQFSKEHFYHVKISKSSHI